MLDSNKCRSTYCTLYNGYDDLERCPTTSNSIAQFSVIRFTPVGCHKLRATYMQLCIAGSLPLGLRCVVFKSIRIEYRLERAYILYVSYALCSAGAGFLVQRRSTNNLRILDYRLLDGSTGLKYSMKIQFRYLLGVLVAYYYEDDPNN